MVNDQIKFYGLYMDESMVQDIKDLTDDFYSDTMRTALTIGLKKMKKHRRHK